MDPKKAIAPMLIQLWGVDYWQPDTDGNPVEKWSIILEANSLEEYNQQLKDWQAAQKVSVCILCRLAQFQDGKLVSLQQMTLLYNPSTIIQPPQRGNLHKI